MVRALLAQLPFWRFWKVRLGYVFRPRERFGNIAAASSPTDAEPQASSEGSEAARSGSTWEEDGRTTTVVLVGRVKTSERPA